jgi:hypothetical protein
LGVACRGHAKAHIRRNLVRQGYITMLNFNVEHWKSVASSSRKDPNLTSADIRAFRIAYPEIPEQRAIAAALCDADALISSPASNACQGLAIASTRRKLLLASCQMIGTVIQFRTWQSGRNVPSRSGLSVAS